MKRTERKEWTKGMFKPFSQWTKEEVQDYQDRLENSNDDDDYNSEIMSTELTDYDEEFNAMICSMIGLGYALWNNYN